MPGVINKYRRALQGLADAAKTRLNSVLEVDPSMAKHLNEYGMQQVANSDYPVAVIPPDKYLQMARKFAPKADEEGNLHELLGRIMTGAPNATEMNLDQWDDPYSTPEFLQEYMKQNPSASAYDIYSDKGIGLPPTFDMHPGIDVFSDSDDYIIDLGGIPSLKYSPRSAGAISITDHEGRGRNAFAAAKDFSMPVQMMERTAILPQDNYIPTHNIDEIMERLGHSPYESEVAANRMRHNEPVSLNRDQYPMNRQEAIEYLRQITGVVPEDYIRYGVNRRGEKNGKPLSVPWKYPVFAEGGTVDDPAGDTLDYWTNMAHDNTGAKRYAALAMRGVAPAGMIYDKERDQLAHSPLGMVDELLSMGVSIADIVSLLGDMAHEHPTGQPSGIGALGAVGKGIGWLADKTGWRDRINRRDELIDQHRMGYIPQTYGERLAESAGANLPYAATLGVGALPEKITAMLAKYGITPATSALGSEAVLSAATALLPEESLEERASAGDTDAQIALSNQKTKEFFSRSK